MHAKGSKWLKITGLLEIIIGCATILLTVWMLTQDGEFAIPSIAVGKEALWRLVIIYATGAIQILAGIVGFVLSNKPNKYKVCMFFGIVLILLTMYSFTTGEFTVEHFIYNVSLPAIVPAYYYYGALLNKNSSY